MRLLYVVHQFLPRYVTGTEQYVRSLALGLRERGHDVRVFACEPQVHVTDAARTFIERDEEVDGIPVRRAGVNEQVLSNPELTDYHNPIAERLLRRCVEAWRPDVLHAFHLRNIGAGGLIEPKRLGIPVVVNLMDFWFVCPRFTLLRRDGTLCPGPPDGGVGCIDCMQPEIAAAVEPGRSLLQSLSGDAPMPADFRSTPAHRAHALVGRRQRLLGVLSQADAIVAPSRFLASMFVANGLDPSRVRHVPYGVDPGRLGGVARARPPLDARPVDVGYIGSLMPHKGLHVLIDALRRLDGDGWRLHVHGDTSVNPAYTASLREKVAGDERVMFHGVFRPTELGGVLARLDLLVTPSLWYENTPFTVLEARLAGLPVVASDLGGLAEAVRDGVDGRLFPAGDDERLASLLGDLFADPTRIEALSGAVTIRTLTENVADFESIYHELLRDPLNAEA